MTESRLNLALAEIAALSWRVGFISETDDGRWLCNLRYRYPGRWGVAITCLGDGPTIEESVESAIFNIATAVATQVEPTCYTIAPAPPVPVNPFAGLFQPAQIMKRKI